MGGCELTGKLRLLYSMCWRASSKTRPVRTLYTSRHMGGRGIQCDTTQYSYSKHGSRTCPPLYIGIAMLWVDHSMGILTHSQI